MVSTEKTLFPHKNNNLLLAHKPITTSRLIWQQFVASMVWDSGGIMEIRGILKVDLKLIWKGAAGFPWGEVLAHRDLGTSSRLVSPQQAAQHCGFPSHNHFPGGFPPKLGTERKTHEPKERGDTKSGVRAQLEPPSSTSH